MKVAEKAKEVLEMHPLCDYCLGRQFSTLGHGLTNGERGSAVKLLLVLEGSRLMREQKKAGSALLRLVALNGRSEIAQGTLRAMGKRFLGEERSCYLCGGAFQYLDALAEMVTERLSEYDYSSFLVGVRVEETIEEREDELRARFKIPWGESIRSDFSREIGRRIMTVTGKDVSFKRPDILVTVNPITKKITLNSNSILVYGHYRKLVRGIPQAKWICSGCNGTGCERCHGTGKLYQDSIEELLSKPLLTATGGTDAKIHAAGREDIDARVLGSGRPFIIEVLNPIRRTLSLEAIEEEVNREAEGKVEVEALEFTSKDRVSELKNSEGSTKVYRAKIEFDEEVSNEALINLEEEMQDEVIHQRTPTRVMQRRAAKLRKRRLFKTEVERLKPNQVEMLLSCEGGLYIKELINGDDGRTTPSVTEITEIRARCLEIDVLSVRAEGFN